VIADSSTVIARLHQAQNRHDINAFVVRLASDYQIVQPNHPDLAV
jgi:hypothetical protein